ncbi:helix-turn-helix transcriptional regulator [Streptomyces sp. NRRL WC-3742]|uniref:helix-turn-helix transcriptional regulator n=1 Tax=Streptomyces sp. NRRL WC-3742 TaxID=1463934 RepID=UPI001F47E4C1|nr:helix-turn-helix transcriptional regulator [Streptomyces sp. NRRL WC-3742]
MQQISVSPVFVGRGSEITDLTGALRRVGSGSPQAVLIGGEAGVGKTRLLEEFLRRAADGGAVTTLGGCLEVGAEGLPFAPLASALRRLYRALGAELESAAAGSEGHLARLLPEFGEADGEPNDEYGRARLFEHTARLFERLGADRTLVLAVEDLHWSDRSTRELFAFLVRTLHSSRVLLIGTYRTDDLHRRHPLRPFLAELERVRNVQRMELDRFRRREVAAQLAGILGTGTPDQQLVDRVHRRSEGNPFFVEELATAFHDGCGAGLPDSLRDMLLVRVESLGEDTQRVVRIAAEGGSKVEHALLAAVLADDEDTLIESLRAAVGANILRLDTDGEGYRFRHALVREAVSDDLLPGERHRINRKFALAVEAQPQLVRADALAARLANYWYHAHDPARALPTALDAARAARRRNAFAEQLGMLERALELWDSVSEEVLANTLRPYDWAETYPPGSCDRDADDRESIQLVDVLAEAVVAARRCGDRERGLSLAKRALKLVDEAVHPMRAAWFRMNRARLLDTLLRPGADEEIAHALRLVEGRQPSAVQAEVFSLSAGRALYRGPGPEDIDLAERAIRIAEEVGAHQVEVHTRMTLGHLRYDILGDIEGGEAELTGAVERARRLGVPDLLLRGLNNLANMRRELGRPEEAVELAREGLEFADGNGLLRNIGSVLASNLIEALIDLGRLEEAAEVLSSAESSGLAGGNAELERMRGDLARLAGDLTGAADALTRARAAVGADDGHRAVSITRLAVALAAQAGRPLEARAELLGALAGEGPLGFETDVYPLLVEGAAVEADSRGLPAAEEGRAEAVTAIAAAAGRLRRRAPLHHGWARLLEVELARVEGADTPGQWAEAVALLRPTGLPYPLALALLRAGEAELLAGRREGAAELLREAGELASVRGDRPLAAQIAGLAERAGLDLAPAAPSVPAARSESSVGDSFGLTPRERDVLRLLARGWTNRQIAEELYISPKTASVHVSNILGKLGVAGRGEAAALAHRLRLFPDDLAVAGG